MSDFRRRVDVPRSPIRKLAALCQPLVLRCHRNRICDLCGLVGRRGRRAGGQRQIPARRLAGRLQGPAARCQESGVCALVQSVTAEDKNNIGLTVYFQTFSNGTRVLSVFAPLGVLLPPGLGLKIDDKDVGHAPFLRCHNFACYAQVVVEDPAGRATEDRQRPPYSLFSRPRKPESAFRFHSRDLPRRWRN